MKFWKQKTPAEQRENRLLRQWRRQQRADRRETIPLKLLLAYQSWRLAATQPDEPHNSNSQSGLPRVIRSVVMMQRRASALLVPWQLSWWCQLYLRPRLVKLRRALLLAAGVLFLKLIRSSSRGRRKS